MRNYIDRNLEGSRWVLAIAALLLFQCAGFTAWGSQIKRVPYDQMAKQALEPSLTRIVLDPTRGWKNSGVFLTEGDLINITASGLVDPGLRLSRGPDGYGADYFKEMTHQCRYMELLGRIADGPEFCVGANATFEVVRGGQLSFHVNELDSIRFDDMGSFEIEIRVITPVAKQQVKSGKPLTVVLDLVATNMNPADVQVLSDALRSNIDWTGKYTLIDQAQTTRTRKELGVSEWELKYLEGPLKIGRNLGADVVIMGEIRQIESQYLLTLKKVNTKTGLVETSVTEVYECPKQELPSKLAAAVHKL